MTGLGFRFISSSVFGALAFFVISYFNGGWNMRLDEMSIAATLGAAVAGVLVAPMFLRPGPEGALDSVLAGILAVFIGGALAGLLLGTFAHEFRGLGNILRLIILGAFFGLGITIQTIWGALAWVLCIALLRWLAIRKFSL